jgi:hypothetical protein
MEMTRESYKQEMEKKLNQWTSRLEAAKAKAEQVGAEANGDLLAELEKFEVAGKQHLAAVEASTTATWDEMKAGLTDKWNHLSGSAEAIWARVREEKPAEKVKSP